MNDALSAVVYAAPAPPPASQHRVISRFSFAETIAALEQAIQAEEMWLVHAIDPQVLLARGGYRIPATRQLLFFHPRYMTRLLEINPNALIQVPLKIVVMQMPDGSVTVRHPNLATLFAEYAGFDPLITELSAICQRITETVASNAPASTPSAARSPKPPFTEATARQKVKMAEDAWNSRDPERVALAYTHDSEWRNRGEFFKGRDAIKTFLRRKWDKEIDYRLMKELWAFTSHRISVRFIYEWRNDIGQWFRSHGNEHWEFDDEGLMRRRDASINDVPISEADRRLGGAFA